MTSHNAIPHRWERFIQWHLRKTPKHLKEDAYQEAVIAVWLVLTTKPVDYHHRGYLGSTIRNATLKVVRDMHGPVRTPHSAIVKGHKPTFAAPIEHILHLTDGTDASEHAIHQATLKTVQEAITRLPEQQRVILQAVTYTDESNRVIGERLGCSGEWVRRQYNKAINAIREETNTTQANL